MNKQCTKCGEVKTLDEFNTQSKAKGTKRPNCKACDRERAGRWRSGVLIRVPKPLTREGSRWCARCDKEQDLSEFNNKGKGLKCSTCKSCMKLAYQANKEAICKKRMAFWYSNRDRLSAERKNISEDQREKLKAAQRRRYAELTPDQRKLRNDLSRAYYLKNREAVIAFTRKWKRENRHRLAENEKKKKEANPLYALTCAMRSRTSTIFRYAGYRKDSKTQEIIGCSFEDLKLFIERQFTKGMGWENYGEWHIDHRIPLSSAQSKDELIYLCKFRNLQPLWSLDNLRKADKVPDSVQLHLGAI